MGAPIPLGEFALLFILIICLVGVFMGAMLLARGFRIGRSVSNLIDNNAVMIVTKTFPAEFLEGSRIMKKGFEFHLVRRNANHGNIFCRARNSGEIFIIRNDIFIEALQENRISEALAWHS